jgi:DNA repair protein RadC
MKAYRGNGFRVLFDVVRDTETIRPDDGAPPVKLRAADDVVRHFRGLQALGLVPSERECFCILLLNARHLTIGFHVCSVGTLNSAPVAPASIFRPALAVGAHALVLAHHHPSGNATPSPEDRRVTDRLTEVGELLGIQVLDHVVLGADRYFSFADGAHRPIL